ncbi:unnamed protein product [Phytophthora fragariaefolia]|uniref:Unnamed protein product n=1 Tax=Phytophthora fragariaefolia TaxID=1490495 RepID=A0A9W6WSX9_9STRA|nr:unnamed protein product [Phytophthora fragariaefolia]
MMAMVAAHGFLRSLPSWDIVITAGAPIPSTTMNIAEYTGINNGAMVALEPGLTDLIIVGDSRLAIQQFMGVVALKNRYTGLYDKYANSPNSRAESLQFESPGASAQVRRVEDQAEVEVSEGRIPDATDIDPEVVQAERRRRTSNAQGKELRWADHGLLCYQGQRRRHAGPDSAAISLRVVVPISIRDEVLHSPIEGGHQGIVRTYHQAKAEFYRVGLYADVSKHVQTCEDCSTSKSKPELRGYSPDNVTSQYLFQMVSMDSFYRCQHDPARDTFYIVHGWDAQSTLKSMPSTINKDPANSADTAQWRREANHQREVALQLAKEYQIAEKAQRAEAHNARLSGKEKRSLPESTQLTSERSTDNEDADSKDESAEPQSSLFRAGDQVWLFMERVRPGLKKKLVHRWYGPFIVEKKMEGFAYELELPD